MGELYDALLGGADAQLFLQFFVLIHLDIEQQGILSGIGRLADGGVDAFHHLLQPDLAGIRRFRGRPRGQRARGTFVPMQDEVLLDQQLKGRFAVEIDLRECGLHRQGFAVGL